MSYHVAKKAKYATGDAAYVVRPASAETPANEIVLSLTRQLVPGTGFPRRPELDHEVRTRAEAYCNRLPGTRYLWRPETEREIRERAEAVCGRLNAGGMSREQALRRAEG